jgi:hypothetical protein
MKDVQRVDEGGRSVRFWEVGTSGVYLKDKMRHGDRHCAVGAGRETELDTVVWCGETRTEYVILIGQHRGEENQLENLDMDGDIILKQVLGNLNILLTVHLNIFIY